MNLSSPTEGLAPVRIGVIGTGQRLRVVIGELLKQDAGLEVTAVFDPDDVARATFCAALAPAAKACSSVEELCDRKDVDWVFIGSFNCEHAAQTVTAFNAGKHVFCEKPLALSLGEAETMREAWEESGRIFAFGLVLRYSPLYRKARKLIGDGEIGRLLSFEFNETLSFNHGGYIHGNWRRHRALAGTHLLEKCCHDMDLALWLTDDLPVRVASFGGCSFFTPENAHHAGRLGTSPEGRPAYRAWADPHGVDPFDSDKSIVDHQVAILEFSSDVRATFHTQCQAGIPERRFYFCGTEGSLRLDAYTGRLELKRIGWDEPVITHQPRQGSSHAGGDEQMALELAEVMRGHRKPVTGLLDGVRSLVVVNAIDEAMDMGVVVNLQSRWHEIASAFDDPKASAIGLGTSPESRNKPAAKVTGVA